MEARAVLRYVRMSPQKARLVANLVRGEKVAKAINILRFTNKASARILEKLILSAKANAENKNVADPEEMKIKTIFVDKGPLMKRSLPRSRGRVNVLLKPFSHATVILEETEETAKKKTVSGKKAESKKGRAEKAKAEGSAVKEGKTDKKVVPAKKKVQEKTELKGKKKKKDAVVKAKTVKTKEKTEKGKGK